nr:hypothetical protein [Tanacetum cinerariifolium]
QTVHEERGDRVERAATTAASLDAEQDSGSSPRRQDTILGTDLLKLGLRGCLNSPMNHLSQELTNLKVGRITKQIYGTAYTKLIKKVRKLEKTAKFSQARRRAKIVVSDDEDDLEDPSKHERKITKIRQDLGISLVQHDAEI